LTRGGRPALAVFRPNSRLRRYPWCKEVTMTKQAPGNSKISRPSFRSPAGLEGRTRAEGPIAWLGVCLVLIATQAPGQDPAAASYLRRGDVWYAKGEWQRAVTEYDRAIALDPRRADAYNNRGNARRANGHLEAASR